MVLCADGDDDRARLDMVSAVTGETYTDLLKDNGMPEMKGRGASSGRGSPTPIRPTTC